MDRLAKIHFDHSKCTMLELGASAVMDVITLEIRNGWAKRKVKYQLGGRLPDDESIKEIIRASGLTKNLKVADQALSEAKAKNYLLFDLISGGKEYASPHSSSETEKAEQKLTDYFDACLKKSGFHLTIDGRRNLSIMVGEMMTNAEEHSGHGRWFVTGYLRKQDGYDEVNIAIFNFGRTIYETFDEKIDPSLRADLKHLSDHHTQKGFFGSEWSEETLWTLYSLQEGVSRYTGTPRGTDRGTGTVRMIEFFQNLGRKDDAKLEPKMCLLSGSAYILFDSRYKMLSEPVDNEMRSTIAFNSTNSLLDPPDKNNVKKIHGHFPGTIVSLKFFLDKKYLSQQMTNTAEKK
jgi:hypothetical protein